MNQRRLFEHKELVEAGLDIGDGGPDICLGGFATKTS